MYSLYTDRSKASSQAGGDVVAVLIVTRGHDEGIMFTLDKASMYLGNGLDSDFILHEEFVPERFLQLTVEKTDEKPRCTLTNLDQSLTLTINKSARDVAILEEGDRITLGMSVEMLYTVIPRTLVKYYGKYYEHSIYDDLTKVYNRRYFVLALQKEIAFSERHNYRVGIAMIDIDQLKLVNDSHGHVVGDEVIRKMANIFAGSMRTEDILGRLGGDEFAVILRGVDANALYSILERLRVSIENTEISLGSKALQCTVSIGATYIDHAVDKDYKIVLDRADKNQYIAKQRGRNCIYVK